MAKTQKQNPKSFKGKNIVENKNEILPTGFPDILRQQEIIEQILGKISQKPTKLSGEINPGEAVEMKDVYSGRLDEVRKEKKLLSFERHLLNEEKELVKKKTEELRLQLYTIAKEINKLASKSQKLATEVDIATFQMPENPGIYHLFFFEQLLDLVKSISRKIEDASIWLGSVNKRAQKKNYWSMYKKHGSKFLLSGEHYLTRSSG